MKGYWKKPEATKEAFRGGRFHTGDIGFIDQDGFVTLADRKKDMILSGGFNVVATQHRGSNLRTPDCRRGNGDRAFRTPTPQAVGESLHRARARAAFR
jgi:non-ribosomal peptide synthetase component E (peptide arylation enzyme)